MLANNDEIKKLRDEVRDLLQFEEEYIDWLRLTSDCSNTETYEIYEKNQYIIIFNFCNNFIIICSYS